MRWDGPTDWRPGSRGKAGTQLSELPKKDITVAERQKPSARTEIRLQESRGSGEGRGTELEGFQRCCRAWWLFDRSQWASPMVRKVLDSTCICICMGEHNSDQQVKPSNR